MYGPFYVRTMMFSGPVLANRVPSREGRGIPATVRKVALQLNMDSQFFLFLNRRYSDGRQSKQQW